MLEVKPYTAQDQPLWDRFIERAKNATFLFKRGFMEYHSDRFQDASLMVFEGRKLWAVLPATQQGQEIASHPGLTYGGLALDRAIKLDKALAVFRAIWGYLRSQGFRVMRYKALPNCYKRFMAEEEEVALTQARATIEKIYTFSVIDSRQRLAYQKRRERGIKKAKSHSLEIREGKDFFAFWEEVLKPRLYERFDTSPVHTIQEIELLARRFPNNIFQANICEGGQAIAGCTVFEDNMAAHAQYIASTARGREVGALDYLFDYLIQDRYAHKPYFDLGSSNPSPDGQPINQSLLDWKEGFGARTMVQKQYLIEL